MSNEEYPINENVILKRINEKWIVDVNGNILPAEKVLDMNANEEVCFKIREIINSIDGPESNLSEEAEPQEHAVLPTQNNTLLTIIQEMGGNDVIEIFGDSGSGKTKIGIQLTKEALSQGKTVYYLDTERNLTKSDILSMKGCTYKYTPMIEEIDKIAQSLPKVDVVVLDSIGFPVLTTFARMSMKQKGDALLKLIAIFGSLKEWAYKNNGIVIVTNQPESDFNKPPGHVLRPFGDKSQFAAKEILKTEIIDRKPNCTKVKLSAFRSRSVGHGTKLADIQITSDGVTSSF